MDYLFIKHAFVKRNHITEVSRKLFFTFKIFLNQTFMLFSQYNKKIHLKLYICENMHKERRTNLTIL